METPGSRDSSALALLDPVLMLIRLGLLITDLFIQFRAPAGLSAPGVPNLEHLAGGPLT